MTSSVRPIQFYPATADGSRMGYTPFIYRMASIVLAQLSVTIRPLGGPASSGWRRGQWSGGRVLIGPGLLAAALAVGVGALFAAGTQAGTGGFTGVGSRRRPRNSKRHSVREARDTSVTGAAKYAPRGEMRNPRGAIAPIPPAPSRLPPHFPGVMLMY